MMHVKAFGIMPGTYTCSLNMSYDEDLLLHAYHACNNAYYEYGGMLHLDTLLISFTVLKSIWWRLFVFKHFYF